MIKKLILISTILIVTSGCSEVYEKYVEGQDVYLTCVEEGSDNKYPWWYSFDTDKEGESTGYYWRPSDPMTRLELKDVVIEPTHIRAREGQVGVYLNRESLVMISGLSFQCYAIGFQNAKNGREKHLEQLTKNNKI
tara:strand:+ start:185 stop:592 length:408 start_codon:yes stop_codon:yes gene_type:complete